VKACCNASTAAPCPPRPRWELCQRQQISSDAKPAIARAAAGMIEPGQVIFIDGGTTAVQLARALPPDLHCTVVTHSPSVAVELAGHAHIDVILIGGRLFKPPSWRWAHRRWRRSRRSAPISISWECAACIRKAASAPVISTKHIKRAISNMAQRTVVLASPEKLDTASPYQIAPLSQVSTIIVNGDAPETLVAPYRNIGIVIIRA
jgi:DeoR/GlpR family transcriptional regulator of sugar metabolism